MPKLRFKSSSGMEHEVVIDDQYNEITLGRSPGNNIRIANQSISRFHAKILFDGVRCTIFDLNSSNGVFVNSKRVRSQILCNGDRLRCGEFPLEFEDTNPAAQPEANPNPDAVVDLKAELESSEEERQRLQSELDESRGAHEETQQKLQDLQEAEAEKAKALEAAKAEAVEARDALQTELDALKAQLEERAAEVEAAKNAQGVAESEREVLQGELEEVRGERDALKAKAEELDQARLQLTQAQTTLGALQQAYDTLQQANDTLQQTHEGLQQAHHSLQQAHDAAAQQRDALQHRVDALQAQLEGDASTRDTALAQLQERFDALAQERDTLQAEHDQLVNAQRALQTEHAQLDDAHEQLAQEHQTAIQARDALQAERDQLAEQLDQEREARAALDAERGDLSEAREQAAEDADALRAKVERLTQEHTRLSDDHARLTDDYARLTDDRQRLTDDHARLNDALSDLQHAMDGRQTAFDSGSSADVLMAEIKALREERDALSATLNRPPVDDSASDALRAEFDALQVTHDALQAERDTLHDEREQLEAERDRLREERDQLRADLDAAAEAPAANPDPDAVAASAEALGQLQAQADALRAEVIVLEARRDKLATAAPGEQPPEAVDLPSAGLDAGLQDELERLRQDEDAWRAREIVLQELLEAREAELSRSQDALDRLQAQLDTAASDDASHEALRQERDRLRDALQASTTADNLAVSGASQALLEAQARLRDERDRLLEERDHLRHELSALQSQRAPVVSGLQDHAQLAQALPGRLQLDPEALQRFVERAGHRLSLSPRTYQLAAAALNARKHLLLLGPSGCGKTSLAHDLAAFAHHTQAATGVHFASVEASWTSQRAVFAADTSDASSAPFGPLLEAPRQGRWLVLDDLHHHADARALFGPFLAPLSGFDTHLDAALRVRACAPSAGDGSWLPDDLNAAHDVLLPPSWRVVATWGGDDLSALPPEVLRQFAFVRLQPPHPSSYHDLLQGWLRDHGLADEDARQGSHLFLTLSQLMDPMSTLIRSGLLGPAEAQDLLAFVHARYTHQPHLPLTELLAEALLVQLTPHFAALSPDQLLSVHGELSGHFDESEASEELLGMIRALSPEL